MLEGVSQYRTLNFNVSRLSTLECLRSQSLCALLRHILETPTGRKLSWLLHLLGELKAMTKFRQPTHLPTHLPTHPPTNPQPRNHPPTYLPTTHQPTYHQPTNPPIKPPPKQRARARPPTNPPPTKLTNQPANKQTKREQALANRGGPPTLVALLGGQAPSGASEGAYRVRRLAHPKAPAAPSIGQGNNEPSSCLYLRGEE